MRIRSLSLAGLVAFSLLGCEPEASEPEISEPAPDEVEAAPEQPEADGEPTSMQVHEEGQDVPGDATEAGCGPIDDLYAMDTRRPVPLQPMMAWHQKQNMNEHLVAIQRIVAAAAVEDWDGVAEASALIESSPQMQQMCQHMGSGAEGFTDLALEFHTRADTIAPAAESQDVSAVLQATSHTLEACTSCHATFRQDVVDAATWQERTGSAHQPGMHGGH